TSSIPLSLSLSPPLFPSLSPSLSLLLSLSPSNPQAPPPYAYLSSWVTSLSLSFSLSLSLPLFPLPSGTSSICLSSWFVAMPLSLCVFSYYDEAFGLAECVFLTASVDVVTNGSLVIREVFFNSKDKHVLKEIGLTIA
ncbi:hypothetical protein KIPB_015102, partial [Kipferlia bialata]